MHVLLQAGLEPWIIGLLTFVKGMLASFGLLLIALALIRWTTGKTEFVVHMLGTGAPFGPKQYWVNGRDPMLNDFIEAINGRLS